MQGPLNDPPMYMGIHTFKYLGRYTGADLGALSTRPCKAVQYSVRHGTCVPACFPISGRGVALGKSLASNGP